ncbi:MAG: hypothetical protein L0H93_12515, partial [Nocardioides sp.]|nr:hypothetical protein [Nocardioides sp.]
AGLSLGLVAALVIALLIWRHEVDDDAAPTPTPVSPSARQDLAADVLDDLGSAIETPDSEAASALMDGERSDIGRAMAENAGRLRVTDFDARYVDEDLAMSADLPEGQWAAAVDTTWQFAGYDAHPAHAEVTFTFALVGDEARLISVGGGDRRTPLWMTRRLEVRRTPEALVMATRGEDVPLASIVAKARTAVRVVRRVVPRWKQKLVVEVPSSGVDLDALLGAEAGEYANIAAVTATVDGSLAPSSPVHVFLNPDVFKTLKPQGAQVVMSHEVTHVATEAATGAMPLWLLEGFGDYVALRDVDLPVTTTAAQIIEQVQDSGPPKTLPGSAEFDTQTPHLGAAYEAAWLACRVLADAGPEASLVALYRRVADGADVDATLVDFYGFGERELVRRWQDELKALAR